MLISNAVQRSEFDRVFFADFDFWNSWKGCDASVLLLDAINGIESEKEAPPYQSLKGFDRIELACPATVSCSDILVLATRDAVGLAGGPFYPLLTGRGDSSLSFPEVASFELPAPQDDLTKTLLTFSSRGFNERETVSLLGGGHSIRVIHCRFFRNRLYNYAWSGTADPSLEEGSLHLMRTTCNNIESSSSLIQDPTLEEPGVVMDYGGTSEMSFGTHYYQSLVQGRGILHADQQLMTYEGTANWVRAYASHATLFRRALSMVMMKRSALEKLWFPLYSIVRRGQNADIQSMVQRQWIQYESIAEMFGFSSSINEGCDASVLLHAINGIESEKEAPPNQSLKGFDMIDMIKSEIELACPATVSCSDILVLATRDVVCLAGGPFYPLLTGRGDSSLSFPEVASFELPAPQDDLTKTLLTFSSRGFNERETVSLLGGGHSIRVIHCRFFRNRLYNYAWSGTADPSFEEGFIHLMRTTCNNIGSSSSLIQDPTLEEPGVVMDYGGTSEMSFGTHYYQSLVQGRGILHADQQLMTYEGTANWVRAYASHATLFRRALSMVMMKLSSKPFGWLVDRWPGG